MARKPMTIAGAIRQLQILEAVHGGDVLLLFDCPDCRRSFAPDLLTAEVQRVLRTPAQTMGAADVP